MALPPAGPWAAGGRGPRRCEVAPRATAVGGVSAQTGGRRQLQFGGATAHALAREAVSDDAGSARRVQTRPSFSEQEANEV